MTDIEFSLAGLRRCHGFLFRYIRLHPIGHAVV